MAAWQQPLPCLTLHTLKSKVIGSWINVCVHFIQIKHENLSFNIIYNIKVDDLTFVMLPIYVGNNQLLS